MDSLTINGTAKGDLFSIGSSTVSVHGVTYAAADTESWSVHGLGGSDTFAIAGSGLPITLSGDANNDLFSMGPGVVFTGSIDGGTELDTLNGGNNANTWVVSGVNSGTLNGASFTGIDTLLGGTNADSFLVLDGGSVATRLAGGGGTDILDYSSHGSPVVVNLQTASATGVPLFAGIETVIGSTAADTLRGRDFANTWLIHSANGGKVGPTAFVDFENLVGGSSDDRFKFDNGTFVSGGIDGGGGVNWLDYSAYTSGVVVNLSTGAATGAAGGVANIQNVLGGKSNDVLTGNALGNILVGGTGTDTLTGGTGRSLLIGGKGGDSITGGSADDLIIGGSTSYDANLAALSAILAEWQSANSYDVRISHLRMGGGLNGSTKLIAGATVKDDLASDVLLGGAGLDWFWANQSQDSLPDWVSGTEVVN